MNKTLLLASALAAITLAGCKREVPVAPAPEAATPAVTASATIAAPATVSRVAEPDLAGAGVQPNAAGFSSKAFAGTFSGTLPCADCPGIDETLELKPDGSFTLTYVYRDRPSGTHSIAGSWNSEENDTRVRLDPNTKSDADRVFTIAGKDALEAVGGDGKPLPGPTQRLTRRN
jgi:copper homeostasis protein (lipoprotein)